jgi:type III restriction enzyme
MRLNVGQDSLPIQPVEEPILNGPYEEPTTYWEYNRETGAAARMPGRRPARYWYKTREEARAQRAGQGSLELDEGQDDLAIINSLRDDVRRWRGSNYEGATNVTKELLRHWSNPDRLRRLFFCQLEAVETIIFLTEIRGQKADGRRHSPRFNPKFTDSEFGVLLDVPHEPDGKALVRHCCKMATGSGKTVVMAMLIAWAFCNRGLVPSDERFPRAVLVCCPNLTVKERLSVLRPDDPHNYYAAFDMVPSRMRPLLGTGKVMVTNWHAFAPESEHAEGGRTYAVVNKGAESDDAFARRILGDLYDASPLMVLNDEAHHAYRPAEAPAGLTAEEKADREEATVWVSGLDRFNKSVGVKVCVDLSATPFYLFGSGYAEGLPFPWIVSDFGLVDAIESGIVKIPRLPVSDTTGRPEPKYFKLYKNITDSLPPGDRLPGRARKPKPEALWREAEGALRTLMSQWIERYSQIQNATSSQENAPPVLIIVCDNTNIAQLFYENISGERVVEVATDDPTGEDEDGDEDDESPKTRSKAPKKKTVYGTGNIFPDYFSNREGFRPTLRIDSKVLAEAESGGEGGGTRQDAAEQLRRIIATVGKPGEPGEQVRCVVSVAMLTEGWDANNVTHILGLRAFGSQLLCEQVVGRGLRRMDYTVDPKTQRLTPEYVDVYGIPFSVIPFKGREVTASAPEDKPKNHVKTLPERAAFEIRFPVVEGYAFALQKNVIRADIAKMERLEIEPNIEPTAVVVAPSVGYGSGALGSQGPGERADHDREEAYQNEHLQTIKFKIATEVIAAIVGDARNSPNPRSKPQLRLMARHQLFPQVLRIVHRYVDGKIDWRGLTGIQRSELGLDKYRQRVVERLVDAIEPDEDAGEIPLMPILNRYKPFGTTAEVDFKTTRRCQPTQKSHINQVVLDTLTWEASAAFYLERSKHVVCYARNEQMGFTIPYEYDGIGHAYEPDFLIRLADRRMLILEVKGYETDQEKAKHQAARRWVSAVNNADKTTCWGFQICKDVHTLEQQLAYWLTQPW